VTITLGGNPVSASNRLPVSDSSLDALIGGGVLSVGGTVSIAGTPSVSLGSGASVALSQGGSLVSAGNRLPVTDTALDALIGGGSLSVGGTVGISGAPTVTLGAGSSAIGTVAVSNLPATQAIIAASLPLPTGAATAVNQANVESVAGTSATQALTIQGASGGVAVPVSIGGTVTTTPAAGGVQAVSIAGTPSVALSSGGTVTALPFGTQAVSISGTPTVALSSGGTVTALPSGTQAVSISGTPTVALSSNNFTLSSGTLSSLGTITSNVPSYLVAVSSGGASSLRTINSAGSAMATQVKASAGMIYSVDACNNSGATVFFRMANSTTFTAGTTPPLLGAIPVSAGTCWSFRSDVGLYYNTGISFDVTTGSMADSDTVTIATANTVMVNVAYK
jgi:hypothetical protein